MITANAAHEGINRLRQKRIPMFHHEVNYQLFVMYVDIVLNTRSESILAPKKTMEVSRVKSRTSNLQKTFGLFNIGSLSAKIQFLT